MFKQPFILIRNRFNQILLGFVIGLAPPQVIHLAKALLTPYRRLHNQQVTGEIPANII
ncbi:hypothetical protein D3C71_2057590 [compost metagenome]